MRESVQKLRGLPIPSLLKPIPTLVWSSLKNVLNGHLSIVWGQCMDQKGGTETTDITLDHIGWFNKGSYGEGDFSEKGPMGPTSLESSASTTCRPPSENH